MNPAPHCLFPSNSSPRLGQRRATGGAADLGFAVPPLSSQSPAGIPPHRAGDDGLEDFPPVLQATLRAYASFCLLCNPALFWGAAHMWWRL